MRELVLAMSVSLDGFVAGPGGDIGWMFGGDQEAIAWKVGVVEDASLHVMGRRTFEGMAAFWPTATGAFAAPMNRIPKVVFSRQGAAVAEAAGPGGGAGDVRGDAGGAGPGARQPGADSWGEAHVADGDLADEIARLKAHDGQPIVAHGGAGFARSLVAGGLVDRYSLLVHPVVLGTGLAIFSGLAAPRRLRLVGSKAFPGGSVAQVYRPA